eukprot:515923_1
MKHLDQSQIKHLDHSTNNIPIQHLSFIHLQLLFINSVWATINILVIWKLLNFYIERVAVCNGIFCMCNMWRNILCSIWWNIMCSCWWDILSGTWCNIVCGTYGGKIETP